MSEYNIEKFREALTYFDSLRSIRSVEEVVIEEGTKAANEYIGHLITSGIAATNLNQYGIKGRELLRQAGFYIFNRIESMLEKLLFSSNHEPVHFGKKIISNNPIHYRYLDDSKCAVRVLSTYIP